MKPVSIRLHLYSLIESTNEGKSDYKQIDSWFDHFGLNYIQNHCSSNLQENNLLEIVKSINFDILYLTNTENHNSYKKVMNKIMIVEGIEY